MDLIKDTFERSIDYMRISITDRCNLRCIFCMPAGGIKPIEPQNSLTSKEIIRIVRTAAGLGVKKIRLTGGEPLIRKDLPFLIESSSLSLCESGIDLKSALRSGASDSEIERLLKLSVEIKPEGHSLNRETTFGTLRSMSRIGG